MGQETLISTCEGSGMLRFLESDGISISVRQAVNFTAEEQALLRNGSATLIARALFNRVPGDAETDTRFLFRMSSTDTM